MSEINMKKLIIIGAGGFGREVADYAVDVIKADSHVDWRIGGFLDDNLSGLEKYNCEFEIIGTIKGHVVSDQNVYICAIGDTETKLKICEEFEQKRAKFINIIHPTARIGRNCVIGIGNVICPNACLTVDVKVGNYTFINCHSNCGHDSQVEDYCTISPFCDITGFAHIGKGVFLGSHSSICPSVRVGDFAKIGAGAAVIVDVPKYSTAVGVPAIVIKCKSI